MAMFLGESSDFTFVSDGIRTTAMSFQSQWTWHTFFQVLKEQDELRLDLFIQRARQTERDTALRHLLR